MDDQKSTEETTTDAPEQNEEQGAQDMVEQDPMGGLQKDDDPSTQEEAKPKKSRKKLGITLGVIAVVLVAVVAGGWTWHEQPSFCGAICHSPMDPYVDGYFSENEALAVVGHRQAEVTCLECHEANISEQVSEAMAWVSGNYTDPLTVRRFGTVEFCGKCHDDGDDATGVDWDAIVETTQNYQSSGRNPHESHLGNVECYTCHSMHGQSKLYCTQCHDNIKTPATW